MIWCFYIYNPNNWHTKFMYPGYFLVESIFKNNAINKTIQLKTFGASGKSLFAILTNYAHA